MLFNNWWFEFDSFCWRHSTFCIQKFIIFFTVDIWYQYLFNHELIEGRQKLAMKKSSSRKKNKNQAMIKSKLDFLTMYFFISIDKHWFLWLPAIMTNNFLKILKGFHNDEFSLNEFSLNYNIDKLIIISFQKEYEGLLWFEWNEDSSLYQR